MLYRDMTHANYIKYSVQVSIIYIINNINQM